MKRGTPEHPKIYELCDCLGCDRPTALGYLELLWHFTAKYAPQGDIGRYSDRRIEAALDWFGRGKPAGKLIEALVDARLIDRDDEHRLVIHDWKDHADDFVRKRLARAGLSFVGVTEKVTGQNPDNGRKVSDRQDENVCLPVPEPVPSQSHAVPVQLTDYPLSAAAVRRRFATADLVIVSRIVDACARAFVSIDAPKMDPPGDAEFAAAIDRAADETRGQESPALFLRTAPAVIESWAKYGRDARCAVNGRQAAYDRDWEEVLNGEREE